LFRLVFGEEVGVFGVDLCLVGLCGGGAKGRAVFFEAWQEKGLVLCGVFLFGEGRGGGCFLCFWGFWLCWLGCLCVSLLPRAATPVERPARQFLLHKGLMQRDKKERIYPIAAGRKEVGQKDIFKDQTTSMEKHPFTKHGEGSSE